MGPGAAATGPGAGSGCFGVFGEATATSVVGWDVGLSDPTATSVVGCDAGLPEPTATSVCGVPSEATLACTVSGTGPVTLPGSSDIDLQYFTKEA